VGDARLIEGLALRREAGALVERRRVPLRVQVYARFTAPPCQHQQFFENTPANTSASQRRGDGDAADAPIGKQAAAANRAVFGLCDDMLRDSVLAIGLEVCGYALFLDEDLAPQGREGGPVRGPAGLAELAVRGQRSLPTRLR
jgi:hypothetical protein